MPPFRAVWFKQVLGARWTREAYLLIWLPECGENHKLQVTTAAYEKISQLPVIFQWCIIGQCEQADVIILFAKPARDSGLTPTSFADSKLAEADQFSGEKCFDPQRLSNRMIKFADA